MLPRMLATSGAFLLGVLCMDLAFDLYAYPPSAAGVLPDDATASIGV